MTTEKATWIIFCTLLALGALTVFVAALMAVWGNVAAPKVFWTGAAVVALSLAFRFGRDQILQHRGKPE